MSFERPLVPVVFEDFPPYAKAVYEEDGSLEVVGPMRKYLDLMAEYLQFDYVLKRPADRVYGGYQSPNGSWSGTIGFLHRHEADFFLGPAGINPNWGKVVKYTLPLYTESNVLVMIRPGLVNDIGNFLKPFTPEVWWMVLSSLFCIIIAMALLTWAEESIFSSSSKFLPSRAIMWAVQTVTQESTEWLPKQTGGRILEVTWLVASLIFMSSYAGILTAMLTVPNVVIPINSKADLVQQTAIPWRLRVSSFIRKYFRDSQLEVDQKVFKGAQEMTGGNCWHSREKIRNGEFVAICVVMSARQILSWDFSTTGTCRTYVGKEAVFSMNHGVIAFRSNSTYFEATNVFVLRVREAGLIDKWLLDETTNATQCLKPPGSENRDGSTPALPLEALLGPFALFGTGVTLAIIFFFLELVVHRYRK